jgi:hypothetical protein
MILILVTNNESDTARMSHNHFFTLRCGKFWYPMILFNLVAYQISALGYTTKDIDFFLGFCDKWKRISLDALHFSLQTKLAWR